MFYYAINSVFFMYWNDQINQLTGLMYQKTSAAVRPAGLLIPSVTFHSFIE